MRYSERNVYDDSLLTFALRTRRINVSHFLQANCKNNSVNSLRVEFVCRKRYLITLWDAISIMSMQFASEERIDCRVRTVRVEKKPRRWSSVELRIAVKPISRRPLILYEHRETLSVSFCPF